MSVWTTKALNRERHYILLKHPLKGVNYVAQGVKFRHGYAVVEKNSKTYNILKKMPILRNAEELPLVFLKKLSFITRNLDVKIIYGQDVYRYFLQELEQEQGKQREEAKLKAELQHLETGGCMYVQQNEQLCSRQALVSSPSQYCSSHILKDPKLVGLGIHVPRFIARDEEEKLKNKVLRQLEKVEVEDGEVLGNLEEAK